MADSDDQSHTDSMSSSELIEERAKVKVSNIAAGCCAIFVVFNLNILVVMFVIWYIGVLEEWFRSIRMQVK
jgi:hypothetical protein